MAGGAIYQSPGGGLISRVAPGLKPGAPDSLPTLTVEEPVIYKLFIISLLGVL
jgi:hypothetical protein